MISARTAALTAVTLIAFAANSILCRLALAAGHMDPASFTAVRLLAGIAVLVAVMRWRHPRSVLRRTGNWGSAAALFVYAIAFSWAYVSLDAGVGALVLFAAVQITMIGAALVRGETPVPREWLGLAVAAAGVVYLVWPGLTAPSATGSALMMAAGVAWGVYSLRGRHAARPLAETAGNFLRTAPALLLLVPVIGVSASVSLAGLALAVLSGAVASGLGYVIWYAALRGLSPTQAALVQLAVPVIAALGGVLLLSEELSLRLVLAAALTLGGIALALTARPAAA